MTKLFRQILPVIKGASRAEIVDACLKSSHLWTDFSTFTLTENIRLRGSSDDFLSNYDNWLLNVGNGVAPNDTSVNIPSDKVETIRPAERHSCLLEMIFWVFQDDLRVSIQSNSVSDMK